MPKRDRSNLFPVSSPAPAVGNPPSVIESSVAKPPSYSSAEPKFAKPFIYHGVDFTKRDSKEWIGICPFCDKPKFHLQTETGQADCKVCHWETQYKEDGVSANHYGFIRYLWRVSYDSTKPLDYGWLSAHRKLPAEAMREWGICKSVTTGEWLVPGYGVKDVPNIVQVYKYVNIKGKYELLPTPGFADGESHGILLPRSYNDNGNRLYITEGAWDAIAVSCRLNSDVSNSFRGTVLGVPGCGIFRKDWQRYTAGKEVVFLYDNDHPKINAATKTSYQGALAGTKRAASIVMGGDEGVKANECYWLDWNLDGKGYDPDLEDGYDVRDWLMKDGKPLDRLLSYIRPVPNEWLGDSTTSTSVSLNKKNSQAIQCVECRSWKELTDQFRLAAKWTPELNGALAVALACVCSVRGVGEPLWTRLISPPSTYKSQLCKALGTNTTYTIMDDGMSGFYSGMDSGDGKDHSLVTKWFDKTLITKEGSTLFTNQRSEQIIGEARAIYDGEIDRRWNNGKHCHHRGWRGTWLLAGTPQMKDYDDNQLGPRFIDYTIVKNISDELEDDIIMRAGMEQAGSGIVNGEIDSSENPDYLQARKLTGGYINYLRIGIDTNSFILPSIPHTVLVQIGYLAKFIERMRGRPSKNLSSENTNIALGARVMRQLVKLARFLCLVMQRESIDKDVMNVVCKVAMDTSDGWSQEVVNALSQASREGDEELEPNTIAKRCNKDIRSLAPIHSYLSSVGVLEWYTPTDMPSPVRQARLRLTEGFRKLYSQVRSINGAV